MFAGCVVTGVRARGEGEGETEYEMHLDLKSSQWTDAVLWVKLRLYILEVTPAPSTRRDQSGIKSNSAFG